MTDKEYEMIEREVRDEMATITIRREDFACDEEYDAAVEAADAAMDAAVDAETLRRVAEREAEIEAADEARYQHMKRTHEIADRIESAAIAAALETIRKDTGHSIYIIVSSDDETAKIRISDHAQAVQYGARGSVTVRGGYYESQCGGEYHDAADISVDPESATEQAAMEFVAAFAAREKK